MPRGWVKRSKHHSAFLLFCILLALSRGWVWNSKTIVSWKIGDAWRCSCICTTERKNDCLLRVSCPDMSFFPIWSICSFVSHAHCIIYTDLPSPNSMIDSWCTHFSAMTFMHLFLVHFIICLHLRHLFSMSSSHFAGRIHSPLFYWVILQVIFKSSVSHLTSHVQGYFSRVQYHSSSVFIIVCCSWRGIDNVVVVVDQTWKMSVYSAFEKANCKLVCLCVRTRVRVCACMHACVRVRVRVCMCVSQWKKVPDEWQARQAIPAVLQVSSSKHNVRTQTEIPQEEEALFSFFSCKDDSDRLYIYVDRCHSYSRKREAVTNPTYCKIRNFRGEFNFVLNFRIFEKSTKFISIPNFLLPGLQAFDDDIYLKDRLFLLFLFLENLRVQN